MASAEVLVMVQVVTDGSVPLENPADYDCLICESNECRCQSEIERFAAMPIEEVDAELRSHGVDPVELGKRGAEFVRGLLEARRMREGG